MPSSKSWVVAAVVLASANALAAGSAPRESTSNSSSSTRNEVELIDRTARPVFSASFGLGPGMSLDGGPAAFEVVLRALADIPLSRERFTLRLALPLRLTTSGSEVFNVRTSMFGIALVPTIQGGVKILPQLQAYLSFGLGPAHMRATSEVPFIGYVSSNATVVEFDLTAGLEYTLDDRFTLYFDPMGLRMFAGSGGSAQVNGTTVSGIRPSTEWTMLVGGSVRL